MRNLKWFGLLAVALLLFASGVFAADYNEAAVLKTKVEAGELPAVADRLPENPVVVTPIEQVGQYGGTLNTMAQSLTGFGTDMHVIGIEPPLALDRDGTSVRPNVLADYSTEDYQTWTFKFRKGMKWSDGAPFTANDMIFWWDDEVNNPEITDAIYIGEFQGATMKKIDDHTVEMTLSQPYPMFEYTLATQWGYLGQWWRPAHYLKQFHPNYTDREKLKKMMEKEGYDTFSALYRAKAGWSAKPRTVECPVLTAYTIKEKRIDLYVWERNPYYWKVDTGGNQLPYIDEIIVQEVKDAETMQGKIVSGEVDIEVWHTTLENYPLYKSNEEQGNYRTLLWQSDTGAEVQIMPNLTIEDEVKARIFQDVRFRQALSLGINRDEINELLYFGKAVPRQYTLHPTSRFYKEEWASTYADYDPEKANALLDEMGLTKRDGDGFRLMPDGRRLATTVEYWPSEPETKTPMMELVKDYWADLGIDLAIKPQDRSLNAQRAEANQIELNIWHGGNVIDTSWQITMNPPLPDSGISWGGQYSIWYDSDGEEGVEPPAEVKRLYELSKQLSAETDPDKRLVLGRQMWELMADNLWSIGTVGMPPYPIVVSSELRNIPENGVWSALWLHRYSPEQFYLAK